VAANGEGGSGSFAWEQREASSTVELRGPLGAGAMRVTFDGGALSVVDSDGRRLDDSETRSLLRERLGAEFPWTELRYWMLGVPAPEGAASVVDAVHAPLRVIEQAGWRVAYDGFRPVAGVSLPARFTAAQGAVRLKVTVDEWRVAGAAGQGP
jgi:outer membrane lipoprotein LolB